jgi:hypothetical protein
VEKATGRSAPVQGSIPECPTFMLQWYPLEFSNKKTSVLMYLIVYLVSFPFNCLSIVQREALIALKKKKKK